MEEKEFFKDLLSWALAVICFFYPIVKAYMRKKRIADAKRNGRYAASRPVPPPTPAAKPAKSPIMATLENWLESQMPPQPPTPTPDQVAEPAPAEEEGVHAVEQVAPPMAEVDTTPHYSPRRQKLRRAIIWGEILRPKF